MIDLTKPSIDLRSIDPEFRWLARDRNGQCYVYSSRPKNSSSIWLDGGADWDVIGMWVGGGAHLDVSNVPSLNPGTCDWKDSLVELPAVADTPGKTDMETPPADLTLIEENYGWFAANLELVRQVAELRKKLDRYEKIIGHVDAMAKAIENEHAGSYGSLDDAIEKGLG